MSRRNQHGSPWTPETVQFLVANYPLQGKLWCAHALGMEEHQIRSKASALKLRARGTSEAWRRKQSAHAALLTGRKRPEQAAVMRRVIVDRGLHIHSPEVRALAAEKWRAHVAVHGHPRGMLGKTFSDATKANLSAFQRERAATETPQAKRDRARKAARTRAERGVKAPQHAKASWKAGWRTIGGQRCYFRSTWEANYARYLELLRASGEIARWEHEPCTFPLNGEDDHVYSYRPDFRVTADAGAASFHEVKGWMDRRSVACLSLMAVQHPAVLIVLVDAAAYGRLAGEYGARIEGWES